MVHKWEKLFLAECNEVISSGENKKAIQKKKKFLNNKKGKKERLFWKKVLNGVRSAKKYGITFQKYTIKKTQLPEQFYFCTFDKTYLWSILCGIK